MVLCKETFATNESPDVVYARLSLLVEKVDSVSKTLMNVRGLTTEKPWIGKLDDRQMIFQILPAPEWPMSKMLAMVVHGQIAESPSGATIEIKIKPWWFSMLLTLVILTVTIAVMVMFIQNDMSFASRLLLWLLVFPGGWMLLVYRKISRIRGKTRALFLLDRHVLTRMFNSGTL